MTEIPGYFGGELPFESVSLNESGSQSASQSGSQSGSQSQELGRDSNNGQRHSIADLVARCSIDHSVGPVADTIGGSIAGYQRWNQFLEKRLSRYASSRNDAAKTGNSRMSAYLHYGMVSPMRLARDAHRAGADKYLDELLTWREMNYGFCFYNDDVETLEAIPDWARQSLRAHAQDTRERVCSWEQVARGKTDNLLWDACQRSLLKHGELHNNVRMTWGKLMLQWSSSAEQALQRLIDLNHRYALDGRDPNSYGGILWCLGQFDRPFEPPKPVYGAVRDRPSESHLTRLPLEHFEARVDRPCWDPAPKIAVVGAGLGGLVAARTLSDRGIDVDIFEKSRGRGGRSATRRLEEGLQFDHGAQYFTIRDRRNSRWLESWLHAGIVQPWGGRIVELNQQQAKPERAAQARFVAIPSMSRLGRHLAEDLNVIHEVRIEKIHRRDNQHYLESADTRYGPYDIVICNAPPEQTRSMIFDECSWKDRLDEVKMSACWTVMVAFTEPWTVPFDGAFVNEGPLRWIARDSSKPQRPQTLDCWVLQASPEWSKTHLDRSCDEITNRLLESLGDCYHTPPPERLFAHAHRWRYAEPTEVIANGCLWDEHNLIGACGDWCNGPKIEAALLSGAAVAGQAIGWLHENAKPPGSTQQLQLF
jgi:hypothetical protein